ncbi:hypothetical protein D3C75_1013560 [compost metagenome]
MVADGQVRSVLAQVLDAADIPLGRNAQGKDGLVDLRPGLGHPHYRPRGIVTPTPRQHQFEQGEDQQRADQHQRVEQQQGGSEDAGQQATHKETLVVGDKRLAMISRAVAYAKFPVPCGEDKCFTLCWLGL